MLEEIQCTHKTTVNNIMTLLEEVKLQKDDYNDAAHPRAAKLKLHDNGFNVSAMHCRCITLTYLYTRMWSERQCLLQWV